MCELLQEDPEKKRRSPETFVFSRCPNSIHSFSFRKAVLTCTPIPYLLVGTMDIDVNSHDRRLVQPWLPRTLKYPVPPMLHRFQGSSWQEHGRVPCQPAPGEAHHAQTRDIIIQCSVGTAISAAVHFLGTSN